MLNKMRRSLEAAASVLPAPSPATEFFLIEFNERPKLNVSFACDTGPLAALCTPAHRTHLAAGPCSI